MFYHIETSQLICSANQLAGFYMMATLAFNELSAQGSTNHAVGIGSQYWENTFISI